MSMSAASRKSSAISETSDDIGSETSGSTDLSAPADGEYNVLLESLDDSSPPLTAAVKEELMHEVFHGPSKGFWEDLKHTMSGRLWTKSDYSMYGKPLPEEEARELVPPNSDGMGWYATIIPDEFFKEGKLARGLNWRDFDVENSAIKPRRPSLPVTASDFFSSITKVDGPDNGSRYIFSGVLNGWPALRHFEVVTLEQRRQASAIPTPKELVSGQILWTHVWKAEQEGKVGVEPNLQDHHRVHRVKLRGAPWSARGWSKESPGFVFWYEAQNRHPRLSYGTNMLKTLGDDMCTRIHMISHRYAKVRESPRDKLTYHSVCLLEWEHGEYCTVMEAAYLNGIAGYKVSCIDTSASWMIFVLNHSHLLAAKHRARATGTMIEMSK